MAKKKNKKAAVTGGVFMPAAEWHVYVQDCLGGFAQRVPRGEVNLAAFDPPYNLGKPYSDYVDTKTQKEYLAYLRQRLARQVDYLHPHGTFFIAINDANVSELDIMCKNELGLFPRRKIVAHYTFGQHNQGNYTQSHVFWLCYTKHKTKYTWNPDAIRVPSSRQLVYNDKRADSRGRVPNDVWVLRPQDEPKAFKALDDTWCFSRVCGTFKAKVKVSNNQMALAMMERIVLAHSNPGDLVVDGFNGSGTTGEAAIFNGRRYIGFDVSKACIAATQDRFKARTAFEIKRRADEAVQLKLFES